MTGIDIASLGVVGGMTSGVLTAASINKKMKDLINIKYWIFDLDNTLYNGQTKVFSEVDKKMSAYISKKLNINLIKAKELQKRYFYESGTTLAGLMKHDNIDPNEFLE